MNTVSNFTAGKNEVKFRSGKLMLTGLLFLPDSFDSSKQYATSVQVQ